MCFNEENFYQHLSVVEPTVTISVVDLPRGRVFVVEKPHEVSVTVPFKSIELLVDDMADYEAVTSALLSAYKRGLAPFAEGLDYSKVIPRLRPARDCIELVQRDVVFHKYCDLLLTYVIPNQVDGWSGAVCSKTLTHADWDKISDQESMRYSHENAEKQFRIYSMQNWMEHSCFLRRCGEDISDFCITEPDPVGESMWIVDGSLYGAGCIVSAVVRKKLWRGVLVPTAVRAEYLLFPRPCMSYLLYLKKAA